MFYSDKKNCAFYIWNSRLFRLYYYYIIITICLTCNFYWCLFWAHTCTSAYSSSPSQESSVWGKIIIFKPKNTDWNVNMLQITMPASSALLLLGTLLTLSPTEAATYFLQTYCIVNGTPSLDCSEGCVNETPTLSGACYLPTGKKYTCIDDNTKVLDEGNFSKSDCNGEPGWQITMPTGRCSLSTINYCYNEEE